MTLRHFIFSGLLLLTTGCDDANERQPWNSPYPSGQVQEKIQYTAFSEQPKHLDPAISYEGSETPFTASVYEPPLQYDYFKRPYTLVPLTAVELPQVQYLDAAHKPLPSNTTATVAYSVYTIRIKPNIRFQPHPAFAVDEQNQPLYTHLPDDAPYQTVADFPKTGTRELTAEDYVYQIKRLADPRLSSPIYGFMSEYIVGLEALHHTLVDALAKQDKTNAHRPPTVLDLRAFELSGAKTLDRYTYQIQIKGKYPQFMYWLTMPFFCPMPWETEPFYQQAVLLKNNVSLDWYPVGTGPFMLAENNPERRMVLAKNPYFDHETYPEATAPEDHAMRPFAGLPIPFLDKIIFVLEKEPTAYWNKFLQGYYDLSGIGSENFQTAVEFTATGQPQLTPELTAKNIRLRVLPSPSVFYWGFNMQDETVGGNRPEARQLRKLIRQTLDVDEFIRLFMNGRGERAHGPLPPEIEGHALQTPIAPDPALAAIKKPNKLYLDAFSSGNPEENVMHRWLQTQFEKIGIELVLRLTDGNRFQEKFRTGNLQIFFYGWSGDYPDPENFFSIFYGPNAAAAGNGGFNGLNYQNSAFDRAFETYRHLPLDDLEGRTALEKQLLGFLNEDAPCVWGFYPQTFTLIHPWVKPNKTSGINHNILKYSNLDPKLRLQQQQAWNKPIVWPLAVLSIVLVALLGWVWFKKRHPPKN